MLKITTTYPKATKVLERWKKYVVQQGRSILAKQKSSKDGLYRKLKGVIDKRMNRGVKGRFTGGSQLPSLRFEYPAYGEFVDQGVSGTKEKIAGAPYSFKKGKKSIKVRGNNSLARWAEKRGLNKWAVAKSVHQKGIKRSLFFTKPFKKRYNRYIKEYHIAVADDIANNQVMQLKKKLKNKITK